MNNSLRALDISTNDMVGPPMCLTAVPLHVEVPLWKFGVMVGLALLSGTFSGLNLGLLGLDVKNLELLTKGPFNSE